MGACRQLYEQTHHILWTTNTFSFDDAVSFGKIMASLNIARLHKLKSLHLSRVTEDQRSPTPTTRCADEVTNQGAWTIACEASRIKVLRGLRTLHVCLEQCLRSCNALVPVHDYNRRRIQQDAQPFLQLRILALEHVAVIVSDNPDFIKVPGLGLPDGPQRKKNEVAEEIRVTLLDPEGAATLRAEKNAKKLEREGKRLDERDGIEKRRENREERAKAEKVQRDQAGQAKTETINKHLEQQIGGAVTRGWMK